jgi:hypothetical protein
MKYTTTANFAMAGALGGGIKTGVLSRITGQLGSTVDKAKNWLQKAKQTKQQVGSATQAKNRLKPQPYVSPNLKAEEIARRKYGQPAVPTVNQGALDRGQTMKSNLGANAKQRVEQQARNTTQASQALSANTRNNNYQYAKNAEAKGVLANAGSGSRTDGLRNQQSLRLRYTKDPRTGKLVSAAYSAPISLLCDL